MTNRGAENPAWESGEQYHIGCKPGDLAENIILVGDPNRVDLVSKKFDQVRSRTSHREYVTATGTYQGVEVSVMGTGMGQDNTEIAVIELCQVTKTPTLIRCGTTGSLQENIHIGDLVVSTGALRLEDTSTYFVHEGYPATAHSDVVLALGTACHKMGITFHTGVTASGSGFYGVQGREVPGFPIRYPDIEKDLQRMGIANFEMESSTLFSLAQLRKIRAGTICAVIAERAKNKMAEKNEIENAINHCIDASLNAVIVLSKMDKDKKEKDLPLWLPINL